MNKNSFSATAMISLAILIGGCASTPQQKLDASVDLQSKTIAVVPLGAPKMAEVRVISSTGAAFGLIGGLADAARFQAHAKDLAQILDQQQLDFHAELERGVLGALENDGLKTVLSDKGTTTERGKWLAPLPNTPGADLYFDVFFREFGYVAQSDATAYVPAIDLLARVTDSSGKQLFYTQILYNPNLDVLGNVKGPKIAPDPQYQFASMDAIKGNPQKAADGLRAAMTAVFNELR